MGRFDVPPLRNGDRITVRTTVVISKTGEVLYQESVIVAVTPRSPTPEDRLSAARGLQ